MSVYALSVSINKGLLFSCIVKCFTVDSLYKDTKMNTSTNRTLHLDNLYSEQINQVHWCSTVYMDIRTSPIHGYTSPIRIICLYAGHDAYTVKHLTIQLNNNPLLILTLNA